MNKLLLILTLPLALYACNGKNVSNAKKSLEYSLKDPSSVEYRNVRETTDQVVCGEYNSKNSYGAYAGFSNFVYFGTTLETDINLSDYKLLCGDKKDKVDIYTYRWAARTYQESALESACVLANQTASRYNKNNPKETPLELIKCSDYEVLISCPFSH